MDKYTVKRISDIFGVTEETVRRWIRSGRLRAAINSKRQGYIVEESDLKEFIHNKSKYLKKYRKHKMFRAVQYVMEQLKKPEVREAVETSFIYHMTLLSIKQKSTELHEAEG